MSKDELIEKNQYLEEENKKLKNDLRIIKSANRLKVNKLMTEMTGMFGISKKHARLVIEGLVMEQDRLKAELNEAK